MAERDDEGFLARWSRRKQAARQAEREPEAEPDAPPAPTGPAGANALEPPPQADRPSALPDPATLDASSDFSVFLGRDVPIETHRAALRRLWRLDPIYNRMDGLDDYCEDYTDQARVVKGLRTAYKVGRGMLDRGGDAAAPSDEAPPLTQETGDPAQRSVAASDDPTPPPPGSSAQQPDSSAQQSDPGAHRRDREKPARAIAQRGPRPLPKRS